jgi:hypothetical protein
MYFTSKYCGFWNIKTRDQKCLLSYLYSSLETVAAGFSGTLVTAIYCIHVTSQNTVIYTVTARTSAFTFFILGCNICLIFGDGFGSSFLVILYIFSLWSVSNTVDILIGYRRNFKQYLISDLYGHLNFVSLHQHYTTCFHNSTITQHFCSFFFLERI